jgi:MFS transporter, ENTS family, enterobactin (siderophore) exporter
MPQPEPAPPAASVPSTAERPRPNDQARPADQPLSRNRDFRTLLVSQSVSVLGDAVSATALPLLVYALTGSGVAMGIVGALNLGADLVFSLFAGAMADRGNRKRMMFLADAGRAVLTALIPITYIVGGPTLAVILLVTGPMAILRGFFRAGYLASMPNLVGRSQLARGNGILETAYSASFVAGPALAGFLVTVIGAAQTLAVDAASFALSAIGLFLIRRELKAPPDRPPSRVIDDIREAASYVFHDRVLRSVILLFAISGAGISPIGSAMTFRIVRDLGLSPGVFGLTLTGFGVGTLVGSIVATRLGPGADVRRALLVGVVVMGLPLAAMSVVGSVPGLFALTALSGAGEAAVTVVYVSVRAANSPDRLVGRIASTARTTTLAFAPPASLAGGILIDTIGGTATLAVFGLAIAVVALAFTQVGGLRGASLRPTHVAVTSDLEIAGNLDALERTDAGNVEAATNE